MQRAKSRVHEFAKIIDENFVRIMLKYLAMFLLIVFDLYMLVANRNRFLNTVFLHNSYDDYDDDEIIEHDDDDDNTNDDNINHNKK